MENDSDGLAVCVIYSKCSSTWTPFFSCSFSSAHSPQWCIGILLSNLWKSGWNMEAWLNNSAWQRSNSVSTVPPSLTHIPITANGLLLQHCLCQFREWLEWGFCRVTEGREYAMGKTFWQAIAAEPDGRYYRLETEPTEALTKSRSACYATQKVCKPLKVTG